MARAAARKRQTAPAPAPAVDASPYDLDKFAPAPIQFTLRGKTYRLPGDPDVDVVAQMLRLEDSLDDDSDVDMDEEFVEAKALLIDLLQEYQPGLDTIQIGVGQLMQLFALMTGGPTVADAVAGVIVGRGVPKTDDADPEDDEPEAPAARAVEGAEDVPLASRRRSSGRSSRSAASTAGRRATGTA